MVVLDRHILRPRGGGRPLEADTPLVVDPNAVGIAPGAFQLLEVVSREFGDIAKYCRGIQPVQSNFRLPPEGFELSDALSPSKASRAIVAEAPDHALIGDNIYGFRQA
jgi:hypothetical protein